MRPIFSLRSLLSIFIGLILGTLGGIGYNSLNSGTAELRAGWPPIQIVTSADSTIYQTSVQGRIIRGSNNSDFIRNMDAEGQYYTAVMNSLPFFQYFINSTSRQYPQYAFTPEKLTDSVAISYVTLANNPSIINIKISCPDNQEAYFLAQSIPVIFERYLADQQNSLQTEAYQNQLKQIETTRASLIQAGQDLINATTQDKISTIPSSKEYIDLSAKVSSLQDELNARAKQAANLLARGVTPSDSTSSEDISPGVLDARIKELEDALQQREWIAAGFTPANGSSSLSLPDTSVLSQQYDEANSQLYTNTIVAMETISTELSKAKVEMNKYQAQLNQEKIAADNANAPKKLAAALAAAQINSLTSQLDSQTRNLQNSSPTVPPSQLPKFYIASAPKAPLPVTPSKNAPFVGALIGAFCGWLVINRQWLVGSKNPYIDLSERSIHSLPVEDKIPEPGNNGQKEDEDWLNQGAYKPLPSPDPHDNTWLMDGLNSGPAVNNNGADDPGDGRTNKSPRGRENWLDQMKIVPPPAPPKPDSDAWFNGDLNITPEGDILKDDEGK